MVIVMVKDKETKNAIRYGDDSNHNLYLKHTEVVSLGNPKAIRVVIEAED